MSVTHFSIQSWSRRSNVESTLTWFPYLIFSQFQQKRNADIDFEWANQFKKKPPLSSNLHITKMNVIHVPFSQQFQQFLFPNLKSLNSLVLVIGGISREKGLATFLREWTDNNQIVSLYRTIGQRGKRIEKPPPPYSSGSSLPVSLARYTQEPCRGRAPARF